MIYATITGRIGKDAVTRHLSNGKSVTSFPVACDSGYGDNKKTIWFDTTIWGERGEKLAQYLTKGQQVTAIGEQSTHEKDGKTYLKLNAADIALQGGKKDGESKPSERHAPEQVEVDPFESDSIPF